MDYSERWERLDKRGEGGQGEVYRAISYLKFGTHTKQLEQFQRLFVKLSQPSRGGKEVEERYIKFRKIVIDLVEMEDNANQNAIKLLHKPLEDMNNNKAKERIKQEIKAMFEISHPNLMKIEDFDPDSEWYVMPYYSKGTLFDNLNKFKGNLIESLKAFRFLVEGVAEIHKKGFIHRDIKPQNIFVDNDYKLILGDFGLIFFDDPQRTRISEKYENVGSRDWMPGWAQGCRIDEIKPSFDVFCLGKVLWAMITGKSLLRLWYFNQPEFNIESILANTPSVGLLNLFFKKCIVEHEKDCIQNAEQLLAEVDQLIYSVSVNADRFIDNTSRKCKVCSKGKYNIINSDEYNMDIQNFGLRPAGSRKFRIYICDYCGYVQLFTFIGEDQPKAWSE